LFGFDVVFTSPINADILKDVSSDIETDPCFGMPFGMMGKYSFEILLPLVCGG